MTSKDWEGVFYVFGIPVFSFIFDIGMRRLIKTDKLTFEEWCYGADLGLAGITTGAACLPLLQKPDRLGIAAVLFVTILCWLWPMILHQKYEPLLEASDRYRLWEARVMLGLVSSITGATGLAVVLLFMWWTWPN